MAEKDFETWQNIGHGQAVIKKFNTRGDIIDEMIVGGRSFLVSPVERRMNQELAANDDLDIFRNGTLAPVRLIEGDEDAAELASNPNVMTESEMTELFKANWRVFDARIAEIKNPMVLERMIEMGGEANATVRQVESIKARLIEVMPRVRFADDPTPVTPR